MVFETQIKEFPFDLIIEAVLLWLKRFNFHSCSPTYFDYFQTLEFPMLPVE